MAVSLALWCGFSVLLQGAMIGWAVSYIWEP